MPSVVYTSFWDDVIRGNLDVDGASFKVLLTTSLYAEDKDAHLVRSSVTNEVSAGAGYSSGGVSVTLTVTKNVGNVVIGLPGAVWTSLASTTLTARKAVYYQVVGTAATDRLVAVVDFGVDKAAINGGTLTVSASTITLTNT